MKHNQKIIVGFDKDGTLDSMTSDVPDELIDFCRHLKQNNNVEFFLSTGRALKELDHILKKFGTIFSYVATENGAIVYDTQKNEKILLCSPEDRHELDVLLSHVMKKFGHEISKDIQKDVIWSAEFEENLNHVYEFCAHFIKQNNMKIHAYPHGNYNGTLDLVPHSINKVNVLKILHDYSKIYFFGDAENDYEMLAHARVIPGTTQNAIPIVKQLVHSKKGFVSQHKWGQGVLDGLKNFFMVSVLFGFIFLFTFNSYALKKKEYDVITAVGYDQPISNGSDISTPIVFMDINKYFQKKDWFNNFKITTTTLTNTTGYDNDVWFAGFSPGLGWIEFGGWRFYDQGYLVDDRLIDGNYIGPSAYFGYYINEQLKLTAHYNAWYYFYNFINTNSKINKPNDHWEHHGIFNLEYSKMNEKNLGLIRSGVDSEFIYKIEKRIAYGTYQENDQTDSSDFNLSHKFYIDFNLAHKFDNDLSIQSQIKAHYAKNVDRNNSEKIGSIYADFASVPGYYLSEFTHNRFFTVSAAIAFPIEFWGSALKLGYHYLYMPNDNKVTGVGSYPKNHYTSVSAKLGTKVGNLVPLFIDYSYAIDAQRKNTPQGDVQKGSHDISMVFVLGFAKE